MLSATAFRRCRGVNLVELMVAMTIFAFLIVMAVPSFSQWLQNSRIRTTAESVLTGLQFAKGEAVSRNVRVRFQLTSTLDASCVLDVTGRNWVVNLDPDGDPDEVAGNCSALPSDTVAPRIVQSRPAGEGSAGVRVVAGQSSVVFTGVGRLTPVPAGVISINISNPASGACQAAGGPMTCLRITISPAGQLRMCNPNFPAGDAQAC